MTDRLARWVIRDIGGGWFSICDRGVDGSGHLDQLAKAFSRGHAEVVRDALEAAWPLEARAGLTRQRESATEKPSSSGGGV